MLYGALPAMLYTFTPSGGAGAAAAAAIVPKAGHAELIEDDAKDALEESVGSSDSELIEKSVVDCDAELENDKELGKPEAERAVELLACRDGNDEVDEVGSMEEVDKTATSDDIAEVAPPTSNIDVSLDASEAELAVCGSEEAADD